MYLCAMEGRCAAPVKVANAAIKAIEQQSNLEITQSVNDEYKGIQYNIIRGIGTPCLKMVGVHEGHAGHGTGGNTIRRYCGCQEGHDKAEKAAKRVRLVPPECSD